MTLKFVWTHDLGQRVDGGTKAKSDAVAILSRAGWRIFDTSLSGSRAARGWGLARHFARLLALPRDTVFFIQFPLYTGRGNLLLAQIIVRRYRTIGLLHDIERLRLDSREMSREDLLDRCAFIISTGLLFDHLGDGARKVASTRLEAWDYLPGPGFRQCRWNPKGAILFAGSLSPAKVPWLYRTDTERPGLLLRGNGYKADMTGFGDIYGGAFEAGDFAIAEEIGWGLVWDGEKIDGAQAATGDYERINQPHKASLYLAAGVPLIVWKEAAIAGFVVENECGITVSSLAEISQVLAGLDDGEGMRMRENALKVGQKIREGAYLLETLKRVEL